MVLRSNLSRMALLLVLAWALPNSVFILWPRIDLAVAHALRFGGDNFWAATHWQFSALSLLLRYAMEVAAIVILLATLYLAIKNRRAALFRACAYMSANILIASLLIVNLLAKPIFGRMRPANITDFGGMGDFTPAWTIGGECRINCAFTSGEASIAATLAISLLVVLWPKLRHKTRAVLLAGGFIFVVSALRVALGRHFLSDVIVSILISATSAFALYPLLKRTRGA